MVGSYKIKDLQVLDRIIFFDLCLRSWSPESRDGTSYKQQNIKNWFFFILTWQGWYCLISRWFLRGLDLLIFFGHSKALNRRGQLISLYLRFYTLFVRRVEGWIRGEGLVRKHLASFGKKDKDIKKKGLEGSFNPSSFIIFNPFNLGWLTLILSFI